VPARQIARLGGTLRPTEPAARVLGALVVLAVTIGLLPATGSAADDAPNATEIGVDAKTIHIATSADVDNALAPGLFKGGVDGVAAAVKYINATGGVGGRKLVQDFYDSKLNPNEARNNIIKACENDLALVGTGMFLLSSFDDAINCTDKAGQATGLPDIPSVATNTFESCAPATFGISGNAIDCATLKSDPQTYYGQVGDQKYYVKKYGPKLKGPLVYSNDSAATVHTIKGLGLLAEAGGIDIASEFSQPSSAPQSAYTPLIQQMKSDGDNYNLTGQPIANVLAMRQEAQLQGFTDPEFIWTCAVQCYDAKVIDAGQVMANTHLTMNFLPFEEKKANKTLAAFIKYVGEDNANAFAVWGWVSTLLFKQAAEQAIKDHGVNGLTRANLITALKNTHSFNAGGMWGTMDPGNHASSPCFAILQFDGSKYVREYPKKAGTLDCKPSNRISVPLPLNN
jgi:ABC-type branched-subunit amino acid transport system substrate-binding protein